jgi:DNA (cytosine-5)-methyltransferase 1
MFRVNDLFCGAGGMGIGFRQAGFEIAGAWDFDKNAVSSYKHNVGEHAQQLDITKMAWDDMPRASVWTFGFPCQDLSKASGSPKGLIKGERSRLFFEVMRLISETKENEVGRLPDIIMAENVRGLKPYLSILEEEYTKMGYKMYVTLYNSKFWGLSQNRERYFVVGVKDTINQKFRFPDEQKEFVPKLEYFLDKQVDGKYFVDDLKKMKIIEKFNFNDEEVLSSPIRYLNRNQRNMPNYSLCLDVGRTNGVYIPAYKVKQATKKGYDIALEGDAINFSHPNSKTRRGRVGKQVAQTLLTQNEQVVVTGDTIREFTPREYARLQGFPEEYEIIVSDREAYKQFGNAVSVPVVRAIAERIKMFLLSL